eukprot:756013-Hanusia_phi.AAC.2
MYPMIIKLKLTPRGGAYGHGHRAPPPRRRPPGVRDPPGPGRSGTVRPGGSAQRADWTGARLSDSLGIWHRRRPAAADDHQPAGARRAVARRGPRAATRYRRVRLTQARLRASSDNRVDSDRLSLMARHWADGNSGTIGEVLNDSNCHSMLSNVTKEE